MNNDPKWYSKFDDLEVAAILLAHYYRDFVAVSIGDIMLVIIFVRNRQYCITNAIINNNRVTLMNLRTATTPYLVAITVQ